MAAPVSDLERLRRLADLWKAGAAQFANDEGYSRGLRICASQLAEILAQMADAIPNNPATVALKERIGALEDTDQAAALLTDLACLDEEDGITETAREGLRAIVLARFPDAED